MKIIIAGSGKVGYTIAEQLVKENHDITVIDTNEKAISRVSDSLDVMVVSGNCASFGTLREAGIQDADMIIAATSSDEVNMLCCQTAKALGAKFSICRIRDIDYTKEVRMLQEKLGIDYVINPELSTAREISRLLRFPSAINVETFYHDRVEMVSFRVRKEDFLAGKALSEIPSRMRGMSFLIVALQRKKEIIIPNGSTVLQEGDKIYVVGEYSGLVQLFKQLGRHTERAHRIFLVGGGRIAYYLAELLGSHMTMKIVEQNADRCRYLAENFPRALIIQGDGTDQELLESENLDSADAFITLTNHDEDNVIMGMYAMLNGVELVIAKSNREHCASVAMQVGLDTLLSPKLITADHILRVVRAKQPAQGSVITALYHIADGQVEAMQFQVTGETKNLGKPLKQLKLKKGVLLAAIIHDGKVSFPGGNSVISEGDSVIVISQIAEIHSLNDIYAAVDRQ